MVEQKFINKIEDLRHYTYSKITDVQKNLCPMAKNIYLNYQFYYWYEGYKYNLWEDDVHIYAVNEIPYCYDNELKNTTFIDTLDNLVSENKVWPFLLFIEGKAIQWSKITIIHDYDYSYLKIDDITPDHSFYTDIIVFPLSPKNIRYGEDNDVLVGSNRKGFYFDIDGKRLESTDFANVSLRLEILDPNIYYKEVNLTTLTSNLLEFTDLTDGYIPILDNIILFKSNGMYDHDGPSAKIENIYNSSYGIFKVINNSHDAKWAILMYSTKCTNTGASYLYTKEDLDKKSIIKLIKENPKETMPEIWNDIINPLVKIFNFEHSLKNSYQSNISNAAKYITRYDFRLWKDVFVDDISIKSFTYTGEEFKSIADNKGCVHFSRNHSDLCEDVAMVFVNHKIYKYSNYINYTNNTINIPILDIMDDDHVEILLFTECNNQIVDIKVQDQNTPVYIHKEYSLDNCYLMSDECPDATYEIPESIGARKQYIVEHTYTKNGNDYRITFNNDYYYGKKLKVVPKKQFRYYRFKQKDGQHKIILPTQFNYCHDPNRYLIFANGKKIDRTEYTITFMNKDRPFDKLVVYLSTVLDSGDYVDIFYIPEVLVEKYKKDSITNNGVLLLEDEDDNTNYPKTYPLSKYTSIVFINGLKVNPLDIKDVSLNTMLIGVDKYTRDENGNIVYDETGAPVIKKHYVDSIDNVTIMEYVIGNKAIAGYLEGLYEQIPEGQEYDPDLIDFSESASDSWKKLIKTLIEKYSETEVGYEGLQKLFGSLFTLEDPEEDYKNSFADLKSILYDVIIDYYLERDDVNAGEGFVYEFERSYFDPKIEPDSTEVIKTIDLFPEKDKLLDYRVAELIAGTDDVQSGQKFNLGN